jgi:hypothetical protein
MSVRVVLASVAALALVAAAQPAVEHASDTREDAALRASADQVRDAVAQLQRRSDPGQSLETAPCRTLELDLPGDATLAVRTDPPRLVSRHSVGTERQHALSVPVEPCGKRSTLDGRVTLAYVERPDGPVVVALRGFIRGDGATASHACTTGPLRDGRSRLRV